MFLIKTADGGYRIPLFPVGRTLATPGALEACCVAEVDPMDYFMRHAGGDWGTLTEEDWQANELALKDGSRLLSSYILPTDQKVWIITEWDRSATTILLPDEY